MAALHGSRGVALALGVLLCGPAAQAVAPPTGSAPATAPRLVEAAAAHKVLRVVSGDTVIVNVAGKGRRVELIGVEIPKGRRGAAREATCFLEHLLGGESVYVGPAVEQAEVEESGRYSAYLYRAPDGLFVNLELVRQGYAGVPAGPDFEHRELFERFEARARDAGKGCWARSPQVEDPPEETAPPAARTILLPEGPRA